MSSRRLTSAPWATRIIAIAPSPSPTASIKAVQLKALGSSMKEGGSRRVVGEGRTYDEGRESEEVAVEGGTGGVSERI